MPEILLSSDDLTVLGGPAIVSVDVDLGPQGERGSQIFVGNGKPNLIEIGQTPKIFDLFINILPSDDEYLFEYQYQNVDGLETWVKLFNLIPNTKSVKLTQTFTAGQTQVYVPVSGIIPSYLIGSSTAANFNVQCTVHNSNPLGTSITVSDPTIISSVLVLPILIKAIEATDKTPGGPIVYEWDDIVGSKIIDLFITVV